MHKVYFVGCGPGDPDLITVKAKKLMQKAQTIVYSGSLIPPKTLKICKGEMHDASGMVREEITKTANVEIQLEGNPASRNRSITLSKYLPSFRKTIVS